MCVCHQDFVYMSLSLTPQIIRVTVYRYDQRAPDHYSPEEKAALERFVTWKGLKSIRKFIVFFAPGHRTLFPYGVHPLVLERASSDPPMFEIRFYHYMDTQNRRVDLPSEQRALDYAAFKAWLESSEFLWTSLGDAVFYPEIT